MATTYSDEFKEKMVHLYNAGKTITELSRDYGVSKSALSKWIKFFNSSGSFREADNHGRINKQIYGNGTSTTYSYDQWLSGAGRLMTLNTKKRNDEFLQELSYSYDPIGNITQLNNMGETLNFSYDALSRLTGVSGAYEESYSYDAATGNLKSKTGVGGNYHYTSGKPHAVTGYDSEPNAFEYDANGQMVKRHRKDISYDAQGKLISYDGKSHVYDGDGNRVMMDHGDGKVTVYIGNYYERLMERMDDVGPVDPPVTRNGGQEHASYFPVIGNGETVDYETHRGQTYYYAGSSRIAMRTIDGEVIWLYGDHLGSTSVTADRHGNELSRTKYYAWGSTRSGTGDAQTNYAYTGQMKVDDIYYYNARWYDPHIGRFMQADTIVPSHQGTQGFDRYAYVNNNPIRFTDPSGHDVCSDQFDPGCMPEPLFPEIVNYVQIRLKLGYYQLHGSVNTIIRNRANCYYHDDTFNGIVLGEQLHSIVDFIVGSRYNGPYDLKPEITEAFFAGIDDEYKYSEINDEFYKFDIWGNLFYGYLGASLGLSESILLAGAGFAQLRNDGKNAEIRNEQGGFFSKYDYPTDQAAILLGIEMWQKHGTNVTSRDIVKLITEAIGLDKKEILSP